VEAAAPAAFPKISTINAGHATRNVLRIDLFQQFRHTYLVDLELVPRLLVGSPRSRPEIESLRVTEQLSEPRFFRFLQKYHGVWNDPLHSLKNFIT
jgi:hypothetical protein